MVLTRSETPQHQEASIALPKLALVVDRNTTALFNMDSSLLRWVVYLILPALVAWYLDRRSQIDLPRVGADPGILKWKVWYARYQFFKNGGKYTTESYQKVRTDERIFEQIV